MKNYLRDEITDLLWGRQNPIPWNTDAQNDCLIPLLFIDVFSFRGYMLKPRNNLFKALSISPKTN